MFGNNKKTKKLFQLEKNEIAEKQMTASFKHAKAVREGLRNLTEVIQSKENEIQTVERLVAENRMLKEENYQAQSILSLIFSQPSLQFFAPRNMYRMYFDFDIDVWDELIGGDLNINELVRILSEQIKSEVK